MCSLLDILWSASWAVVGFSKDGEDQEEREKAAEHKVARSKLCLMPFDFMLLIPKSLKSFTQVFPQEVV